MFWFFRDFGIFRVGRFGLLGRTRCCVSIKFNGFGVGEFWKTERIVSKVIESYIGCRVGFLISWGL